MNEINSKRGQPLSEIEVKLYQYARACSFSPFRILAGLLSRERLKATLHEAHNHDKEFNIATILNFLGTSDPLLTCLLNIEQCLIVIETCPHCQGSGAIRTGEHAGSPDSMVKCGYCEFAAQRIQWLEGTKRNLREAQA